jgi:hypothetical protein
MHTHNQTVRRMRLSAFSFYAVLSAAVLPPAAAFEPIIAVPPSASPLETLATRETMRYLYLRTGRLLPIAASDAMPAGDAVIVTRKDRPAVSGAPALLAAAKDLGPQHYLLKTVPAGGRKILWIVGGDDAGTLYGAYRFAERLGVRFYLHGDTVPDDRVPFALPDLDETGKPLFDIRGIQPFHDFQEGPDWWDLDDYLAYIGQLAKMRMNFLGLHCYPEGGVGPEPAVWIGLPADVGENGQVKFSYPAQWASTLRGGMWGYADMKTSAYSGGASLLFPDDVYGPAVHDGLTPRPRAPEQSNELFRRTAELFRAAFARARALGVKTCIGTETPLTVPKLVKERVQSQGKDPKDPAVVQELYRGMFARIAASYPVDYYWLWTPEDWTWKANRPEQYEATVADIRAALAALDALGKPFVLATSGWVLGPTHDRSALDKILPKACPMSCINRQVGHAPVEPGFANVTGRPTWAIPWVENDPNMVAPQPWVGRMRYDAWDARRLGCTGLLGIHWRTKILAQNLFALAAAGWNQSWASQPHAEQSPAKPKETGGPIGGQVATFTDPVSNTEEAPVYQAVRYDMNGYHLVIPNGTYTVTLKFNEPHYAEAGKRVFGVAIQGKTVLDRLDLFAKAGKNVALDCPFAGVAVTDGQLMIDFTRHVEFPCIAGIVVEGKTAAGAPFVRKINCGGAAWKGYEADAGVEAAGKPAGGGDRRGMPIEDFYLDWARANFGEAAAEAAGAIFARIDGRNLPEPSTWTHGPGGIKADKQPWETVKAKYAFVDALAALRPRVKGAGNVERFDYWLNTYRFMAAMAEAGCLRGQLDRAMDGIKKAPNAETKKSLACEALEIRLRLARVWERMMSCQVAAADTPGELGTICNLEQHNRRHQKFIEKHDPDLTAALGAPLPADAAPGLAYRGPARIIVPTLRSQVNPGEPLSIKVILLAADDAPDKAPPTGALFWRPIGKGDFAKFPLAHAGRRVYKAQLPPAPADAPAVEYYIQATCGGAPLVWPPTAPAINQTIVIAPMTITMLLQNTVKAAELRLGR